MFLTLYKTVLVLDLPVRMFIFQTSRFKAVKCANGYGSFTVGFQVKEAGSLTAEELAQLIGLSVILSKERLGVFLYKQLTF